MRKILLNDGSEKIASRLSKSLHKDTVIISEPFQEKRDLGEFNLIALYAEHVDSAVVDRIHHLQLGTKFRNIPVVLLAPDPPPRSIHSLVDPGTVDIFPLSKLSGAFGQILKNHMICSREPMDSEMEYLTPFISGTMDVFSTMASMDVRLEQVYFQQRHRLTGDISGVIDLSGGAKGMVAITFCWELARQIISGIMGVTMNEIDPELLNEGVGEILTMIGGSARRYLTDTPYRFQMSLPTVILGCQQEVSRIENPTVAVLVFDAGSKSFSVQVSLASQKHATGGQ